MAWKRTTDAATSCKEDKLLLNLMLKKALVTPHISKHNTYMGGNLVELR